MIIGITGSLGGGKGETAWEAVARGCQLFLKNSDNLNSACKAPVPEMTQFRYQNNFLL